ncbi:MAG: hypothetical protein R6U19_08720 [Bacteroidales bacterium]
MIDAQLIWLIGTAASLGFLHTLLGPDHYVPFLALSRARGWSIRKTACITGICGLAHVGSSVGIGIAGLSLNHKLASLEAFEALRGNIVAWLIIAFGLAYMVWGIKRAFSIKHQQPLMEKLEKPHSMPGTTKKSYKQLLPWILFVIFLLGPCEPLIPLLMFPAASISTMSIALVAGTFGIVTMATMITVVVLPLYGVHKVKIPGLQTYGHALAGSLIMLCGIGVQFLGL